MDKSAQRAIKARDVIRQRRFRYMTAFLTCFNIALNRNNTLFVPCSSDHYIWARFENGQWRMMDNATGGLSDFKGYMGTCVDRLAGDGGHTIAAEMAEIEVQGYHDVDIADGTTATVALKYKHIRVLPPIGKQKRYPALNLTVIHAVEQGNPEGRPPIDWKLITDLPVDTPKAALAMLIWYAMRWKIEIFHKILKSGCRAEDARLRTAERLVNLIALFCILSWRIFWMTMINRAAPGAAPTIALTSDEVDLLNQIAAQNSHPPPSFRTLSACLTQIAKLGGYLARAHDPPPGNIVMWRGWSKFMDIKRGAQLAMVTCG